MQLPADLIAWRNPGLATDLSGKLDERIWGKLRSFFKSRGYTYWPVEYAYLQTDPGGELVCNGFGYASLQRGWDSSDGTTSSYQKLKEFDYAVRRHSQLSFAEVAPLTSNCRILFAGQLGQQTGVT